MTKREHLATEAYSLRVLTRLRTRDTVPQHDSAERNACTVPGQGMGKMRMHHQGKAASL